MTTGFCSNGSRPPALALLVSWFFSPPPYTATPLKFLGGVLLNLPLLPFIPIQSNSVKQKTLKSTSSLHPSICQSGSVKALHSKGLSQRTRVGNTFSSPLSCCWELLLYLNEALPFLILPCITLLIYELTNLEDTDSQCLGWTLSFQYPGFLV